MHADHHRTGGFSLLEVMVALTIGGSAVALAAALLVATGDQSAITAERAADANIDAVGERLVRRLVGQMEWSRTDEPPPRGTRTEARFVSSCDVPAGWQERCLVELELPRDDEGGIIARLSTGGELRLMLGRRVTAILYLRSASHGGQWADQWIDSTTLPPAIGLEVGPDTLILRIGDRG